jgi:hypothetical protein
MSPILSDDEVDEICAGLVQSAAKVRFLRRLGVPVERKPNGRPLVCRAEWERRNPQATAGGSALGPKWKKPLG